MRRGGTTVTAKSLPTLIMRPLVKVTPLDATGPGAERRLGFLAGEAAVPDDFDLIGAAEIESKLGRAV